MIKTIWYVDDDEGMLRAMELMLKMLNFKTRFFCAPAAEALLTDEKPDLLLLDINMPEISEIDMLEFVRRRTEWKNLPVVMLSTEASDKTVDQAMSLAQMVM